MAKTYAAQSGGCRFESLWGFGFSLKGAYYEVGYCGKKTFLAGLQCTLTSSCAKTATESPIEVLPLEDQKSKLQLISAVKTKAVTKNLRFIWRLCYCSLMMFSPGTSCEAHVYHLIKRKFQKTVVNYHRKRHRSTATGCRNHRVLTNLLRIQLIAMRYIHLNLI